MPDKEWSFFENGVPGLHLIINPQKPLPPEARINSHFLNHNIKLSARELEAIMAGRSEGITAINSIMGHLLPGFGSATRLKFSTQIADALLDKGLPAQLSREAPTGLERLEQRDLVLKQAFDRSPPPGTKRAPAPTLLEQVPAGVSLTVYF